MRLSRTRQRDRGLGRREAPPDHRLEELERQRVVAGIEAVLIVVRAKVRARPPVRLVAVAVAHVPVEPHVVEEVVTLEDAVVLHDPVVLLGHERLNDHRGELGVVQARERVADVVDERAHDVFLVAAVAMRARRGLQRVSEPVDRVTARIAGEQREMGEDPIGQVLLESERVARDETEILGRGVDHSREGRHRGPIAHVGPRWRAAAAQASRRRTDTGLVFVGPRAETLALLGDKVAARALAARCGVPVPRGTDAAVSLDEARVFLASLGPDTAVVVKAVAGGGGRGLRVVRRPDELDDAWARCRSEAQAAFGDDALYVEELLPRVRHVEVQVIGDGTGVVIHLGERDCSLQRRHQKLVEVTPAPGLADDVRARLAAAAVRMAAEVRYANVGTFEFLVDAGRLAFIEANPRLQVEHTVTEELAGVDLVAAQLEIAAGRSLAELGFRQEDVARPRAFALEVRVNCETLAADGSVRPSTGVLGAFDVPTGPGVRVDTAGYAGYRPSTSFESLPAKVVVRNTASDFAGVVAKTCRALSEFRTDGVSTNLPFLRNLLRHPALATFAVTTRFV